MVAEIAAEKQRGRPFSRGVSGNPAGRPKGSRNRATLAVEALLDGEAEALTRKAVELALAGDTAALRLCIDRILPARKERAIALPLPIISNPADAQKAVEIVIASLNDGRLSIGEAGQAIDFIGVCPRTIVCEAAPLFDRPRIEVTFFNPSAHRAEADQN